MASEALQRHDPRDWTKTFAYRRRSELPYDSAAWPDSASLMLDTTVYIDARRPSGLPVDLAARIDAAPLLHSAVALSELALAVGFLDPAHSGTPAERAAMESTIQAVDPLDIVQPSAEAWIEASVIVGILARAQGLPAGQRRKLLNDALIFLSAGETRAVLVSRNKGDVDLLLRFRPDVRVILYDRSGSHDEA